jgi:hypothetical protein
MKTEQRLFTTAEGWKNISSENLQNTAQLVFVFGDSSFFRDKNIFDEIKASYPKASVVGCSSAGEVLGNKVLDDSLVTTAIQFEHSSAKLFTAKINDFANSIEAGEYLANLIDKEDLKHVVVLSDGLQVNGSQLVEGMGRHLTVGVGPTGGLAGDADRFKQTYLYPDGQAQQGIIVAIGFYGSRLKVGYGSRGGWTPFGSSRSITRAKGNILYELDGQPALNLYKELLGEKASELPGSSFYFPLSYRAEDSSPGIIRTILAVDEKELSLTLAGDVVEGGTLQLSKFDYDRLINGSKVAAEDCFQETSPEFALIISCVGRKIVLSQRVEEELDSAQAVFGESTAMTGFYSYGEISPNGPTCQLHNQTMSITTFHEK